MAGPAEVNLEIVTTSQVTNQPESEPTLPKITMNGDPFPAPQPASTVSGWQIVVIDSTMDMTDPASIRLNLCQDLWPDANGSWTDTYVETYEFVARRILCAGDPNSQLLFLVSYGWDANAAPTAAVLQTLLPMGAGAQIQTWEFSVDPGSESGDWVSNPACYILVTQSGNSYGMGSEVFEYPGTDPVQASLSVTLANPQPPE